MPDAPSPRRLRRLLGRLTAATLGVATLGATTSAQSAARRNARVPGAGDDAVIDGLLDSELDDDPRHVAAAHYLAVSLERMAPMQATHTACRWALSPDVDQRLTLAGALEWAFPLVGDRTAIDHLSRDPDPRVRAAAARAAWARHPAGGDPGVLARLAGDPDPEVREVANLALRGR